MSRGLALPLDTIVLKNQVLGIANQNVDGKFPSLPPSETITDPLQ